LNIEKAIIGRMLMDSHRIPCAKMIIKAEYFQSKKCAAMFTAMVNLYEEGKPVDLVTLQDKLKEMGYDPEMASLDNMKDILNWV